MAHRSSSTSAVLLVLLVCSTTAFLVAPAGRIAASSGIYTAGVRSTSVWSSLNSDDDVQDVVFKGVQEEVTTVKVTKQETQLPDGLTSVKIVSEEDTAPSDTTPAAWEFERPVVTEPEPFTGKVLVAGASGFVGSKVCQELSATGATVVGLCREGRPANADWNVDSVQWIAGSALDVSSYQRYATRDGRRCYIIGPLSGSV
jgi:NAD dependent epimerase/dehydratase family